MSQPVCEDMYVRFKNYLKDCQQFVSLNGKVSSPQMIKTGVAQGCALEPFLFLIFVNDLPQYITNAHSNIFTDDSVLYNGQISK